MSYAQPQVPAPPAPPQHRNGFGTTGFVLGLLAAVFAWIPFVGVIGWPLAILGLIFSGLGLYRVLKHRATNKGMTIAGLVLSVLGLLFCIIYTVSFANAVSDAVAPPTVTVPSASAAAAPPAVVSNPAPQSDLSTGPAVVPAGKMVDVDGVQLTADKLSSTTVPGIGPQLCTTVHYTNTTGNEVDYNAFDWKLQTPAGNIVDTGVVFNSNHGLNSGKLAPSGKVNGDLCWDTSAQSGTYQVQYRGSLLQDSPQAVWKSVR